MAAQAEEGDHEPNVEPELCDLFASILWDASSNWVIFLDPRVYQHLRHRQAARRSGRGIARNGKLLPTSGPLVRDSARASCFRAFLHNHWLGLAVFAGIALDFAVRVSAWPRTL